MKPLDLRIHEKHPTLDAYRFGPSYTPYAIVAVDKRFTEAELAAEFHCAVSGFQSVNVLYDLFEDEVTEKDLIRARDWMFHMESFATRPHFDEDLQ